MVQPEGLVGVVDPAVVLVEVTKVVEAGGFAVVWEPPPVLAEQVNGSGPGITYLLSLLIE